MLCAAVWVLDSHVTVWHFKMPLALRSRTAARSSSEGTGPGLPSLSWCPSLPHLHLPGEVGRWFTCSCESPWRQHCRPPLWSVTAISPSHSAEVTQWAMSASSNRLLALRSPFKMRPFALDSRLGWPDGACLHVLAALGLNRWKPKGPCLRFKRN